MSYDDEGCQIRDLQDAKVSGILPEKGRTYENFHEHLDCIEIELCLTVFFASANRLRFGDASRPWGCGRTTRQGGLVISKAKSTTHWSSFLNQTEKETKK